MNISPRQSRAVQWSRLVAVIAISALVGGCAGRTKKALRDDNFTLNPPLLVSGPAALLLTNTHSFSARVTIETPSNPPKTRTIFGVLLNDGNRVLLAPVKSDSSFIWDTARNSGYVINEALEGFAPYGASAPSTNFIADVGTPAESVNGHPSRKSTAIMNLSDGTTAKFTVWRAADLNDFPLRIQSVSGTPDLTVNFSDLRPETPATGLFEPPDGFMRYGSLQAIKDELTIRKARLKNKPPMTPLKDNTGGPPTGGMGHP